MSYSLRRSSGGFISFNVANVESATLSRQATGPEELRLRFRTALAESDRLTEGEHVTFFHDGVEFFTGRCDAPSDSFSADMEGREFVLRGPWVEFENRTFFGTWKNSLDEYSAVPRSFTVVDGEKATLGAWVQLLCERVKERAERQGSRAFQLFGATGQFDAPFYVPIEALGTMTFAEAVTRACKWVPDLTVWFRHWQNVPPVLRCDRAWARSDYTVRLGHDYGSEPGGWQAGDIRQADGFSVEGVVIVWIVTNETDEGGVTHTYTHEAWPPTAVYGDFRVMVIDAEVEPEDLTAPLAGLAEILYTSLRQFRWQGSVTWQGNAPLLDLDPGLRVNVFGGRTAWREMYAFVDSVEHDLMQGTTTLSFGPPKSLGFDDFRELLRFWRERTKVPEDSIRAQTEGDVATYGFAARDSTTVGFGRKTIYFNENGSLNAYMVPAKPVIAPLV